MKQKKIIDFPPFFILLSGIILYSAGVSLGFQLIYIGAIAQGILYIYDQKNYRVKNIIIKVTLLALPLLTIVLSILSLTTSQSYFLFILLSILLNNLIINSSLIEQVSNQDSSS